MEYQRLEGTDNLGVDYEHRITALFSLRFALSKYFEEFWIASNVNYVGYFDDIVISLKSTGGQKIAFLIQLKHLETDKKLQPENFTYSRENTEVQRKKSKENFSIEKYWKGFDEFQSHFRKAEEEGDQPIIKELRKADEIILILYTNKGVDECNFLKESKLNNNFCDLLDSNDVQHCYGFEPSQLSKYNADFLRRLRLFASQLHAEKVVDLIKKEIRNFLKLASPSMIDFNEVVDQYVKYVKAWIKGYKIGKETKYYTLTKPDVLKTLVGILLNKYKHDFNTKKFNFYEDSSKIIWNQIIVDKAITLLNKNENVVQFINSYYGSEVRKFIQKPLTVWGEQISQTAENNFYETFGYAKVAQVTQNVELSMMLMYKTLWVHGSVPLLLDLEDPKYFNDVLKILQVCEHSIKVIILISDSAKVRFIRNKLKYFVTFCDLDPDQQNKLLEVEVNFQGRTCVPLNNLVDTKMYKIIKCHDIINIVSKEFVIGNKFEKMFKYFIARSLSRVFLRHEVLKTPNETFLIEARDKVIAQENLKSFIPKKSKIHFINPNEAQKKDKGTVHRLIYNEEYLEWQESVGNITNLRNYQLVSHENQYKLILYENLEGYFTNNLFNQTRIISACTGMGKSILIDFLAFFAPQNVWVIKIKLNQMAQSKNTIKNDKLTKKSKPKPKQDSSDSSDSDLSDNDTSSSEYDILGKSFDVFKYFDSMITDDEKIHTPEISLAVFKKFMKANKILILLDGFDEISILHKKKVTEIIELLQSKQHAVWVTTRDHMKTHLEDALSVLASTIKPFTPTQQKRFLNTYFNSNIITSDITSKKLIVNEFVDRLLDAAAKNLRDRDGLFTGIPLQTKLLADVFLESCKNSCENQKIKFNERFNLLKLYDKFVKKKNQIVVERFGSNENILLKSIEEAQQYFALYNVFGSYTLRNFKIEEKLAQYYEDIKSQLVQREGILVVVEGKKGIQIEFIHQTFAEYFVAKFLSENFSNSREHVRRNVLSLINQRFCLPDGLEFLFSIFDIILAQKSSFHLKIINLKIDKISQKIEQDPNVLLEQDDFERTGLHMLALYSKEIPEPYLESLVKNVESLKVVDLETTDRLGYNVFDYCIYFANYVLARALCTKSPYIPLKIYSDVYFPKSEPKIFTTIFHNFLIRDLLLGEIFEDTLIYDYCRKLTMDLYISCDSWKFKTDLNVATVAEYLKLVKIKDSKTSTYFDIRFAVALGSKNNVEELFASHDIDVNAKDANNGNTLLHYASDNNRSDIFEYLLDQGADVNLGGRNGNTVIHILARTGQVGLLEKCLDVITNYDVENDDEQTPVDYAIWFNKPDTAKMLVLSGAKINKKNSAFIHNVAEAGDNELMIKLLKQKFNINYQLYNQKTALHSALEHNHIETAKLLIKHNIDVSLDTTNESLLHLVAKIGNLELFKFFLSKGCNIDRKNKLEETPLIQAIKHGHAELAEFIISKGADVSIRCKYGNALSESFKLGSEKVVSLILDQGCNINETIIQGRTPLLMALGNRQLNMARLILSRNPSLDVTLADTSGFTPLHHAAANGYVDLVTEFLKKQANINAQTDRHKTPLLMALENGKVEIAEILFKNNANVLLKDKNGETPLHFAASLGHCDLVAKFLEKGASVNKENNREWTSFSLALENGHNETGDLLLKHGADLTKETPYRTSVLTLAAGTGNSRIIMECIKLKMNINSKNTFGVTPLFNAVNNKQIETAKLLICNGADYTLADNCQNTILHSVAKIGCDDFLLQMLNNDLDVNALNNLNETPLCVALQRGHLSTTELLLSRGSKLDSICKDGRSILHLSASSGFEKLLILCLENKSFDINKEDNEGMSPLEYAVGYGNVGCAKLLLESGAHVNSVYIYYLFSAIISKIKTEKDMSEALSLSQQFVDRCGNINRRKEDQNTILHQIILSAKKARPNNIAEYGEKLFEKILKLLVGSGANVEVKNRQGKSAYELIYEDNLDHLMYIFK